MRANERALLTACIDTGISFGWNRAHKHTDEPNEHRIQEEIENAIWYEIDQYFVFDSEQELDEDKGRHCCPDWDFLEITVQDPEFQCCTCPQYRNLRDEVVEGFDHLESNC